MSPLEGEEGPQPPPKRRRGGGDGPIRTGRGQGRGGGRGGVAEPGPPVPPDPPVDPPPVEPVDDDPAPIVDDGGGDVDLPPEFDDVAPPRRDDDEGNVWHDGLDGARVCFRNVLPPGATEPYANFKIKCGLADCPKKSCMKTKGAQHCKKTWAYRGLGFPTCLVANAVAKTGLQKDACADRPHGRGCRQGGARARSRVAGFIPHIWLGKVVVKPYTTIV